MPKELKKDAAQNPIQTKLEELRNQEQQLIAQSNMILKEIKNIDVALFRTQGAIALATELLNTEKEK